MKTLNEYLIKNKISRKGNKFGYTPDDLTGDGISLKDVKEGMYIMIYINGHKYDKMYALARKPLPASTLPHGNLDQIWIYAGINRAARCLDCFSDSEPRTVRNYTNTFGADSNSIYIMNEEQYRYFISEMEENKINIPDDFLIE